jgi:hypothetical protein
MNNFVLMLLIAMFLLPAAWAVEDVPEVTENFDISDEDLFLDLGLAIGGITSGRIDPQAAGSCEGSAICKQTGSCSYKCFGAAGGDYNFEGCSGLVGLTICKFQGGPDACTARCLPNPF